MNDDNKIIVSVSPRRKAPGPIVVKTFDTDNFETLIADIEGFIKEAKDVVEHADMVKRSFWNCCTSITCTSDCIKPQADISLNTDVKDVDVKI